MKSLDLKKEKVEINEDLLGAIEKSSSDASSNELDFFTNFFENLSKNVNDN